MTASAERKLPDTLRKFVEQGGALYASDLRFDTLAAAFPEYVDEMAVAQGIKQDFDARVLDADLRAILGDKMPLHFDLEGWRPAAFGGPRVINYLQGELRTTAGVAIEAPLLVKFSHGSGTVVFTSFHNEKQHSENEIKLLKYLVFATVTAKLESKLTKTMISGGFSPEKQNLLIATAESPAVTNSYVHPETGNLQFALGFDRRGATLRLEVVGPGGERYEQRGESTLVIDVPGAPAGTWRYTVTAERIPYPNFPLRSPSARCRRNPSGLPIGSWSPKK